MGGSEWAKEINLDKDGEGLGTRKNVQRPLTFSQGLTARRRRGHSSQWLADVGSQMRQRRGSPAGPTEVAASGTAFPAAVASAAKQRDKSHPRPRPSNPSCSGGDASREKQGAGRGNPSLWGLRTGVWGRGRSRVREDGEGGAVLPL